MYGVGVGMRTPPIPSGQTTSQSNEAGKEKEEIIREIHHRIKNNLQIVLSILQLQIRRLDGTADATALRESANRIQSIALSHEMLYRAPDLSCVSITQYARELLSSLIQSVPFRSRIRYHVGRAAVLLDLEHAIPFGLILSELVTASLRCAALDPLNEFELEAGFTHDPGMPVQFTYRHQGGRGSYEEVLCDGGSALGWRLVEALVNQMRGRLELEHNAAEIGDRIKISVEPEQIGK